MNKSVKYISRLFVLIICISSVLIASAIADEDTVSMKKSLDMGISQIRSGEYQNAVETFDTAIVDYPDFATAWAYMGFAFQKMEQYDDAIDAYDAALAVDPGYLFAWMSRSRASMDKSRKEIQGIIDKNEENVPTIASEVVPVISQPYQTQNLFIVEKPVRDSVLLLPAAEKFLLEGETDKGISLLKQTISDNPENFDIWQTLGISYLNKKAYDAALAVFQTLIELDPARIDPWIGKGIILMDKGDLIGAETLFTEASQYDPQDPRPWLYHAEVSIKQEEYLQALSSLNTAIELGTTGSEVMNKKGHILLNLGMLDEAQEAFKQAILYNPDDTSASGYAAKGDAYYQLNRYEEALIALHKAVTIDPNLESAWLEMVQIYTEQGDTENVTIILNTMYGVS